MPSPAIRSLLSGSRERLLLLDSNLLLLWITARYDMRLLATFKRVKMSTQTDAFLLTWIIDQFKSVVTTTHVVTDVSNLGNALCVVRVACGVFIKRPGRDAFFKLARCPG
jgi:hypothetical protein